MQNKPEIYALEGRQKINGFAVLLFWKGAVS